MDFSTITFLYPVSFLLLIVFALCTIFCKKQKKSLYFSNTKLLRNVTSKKYLIVKILKFLIVLFMVMSLASPVKKDLMNLDNTEGYELSLLLDASGSMQKANKFGITKEILEEFIRKRNADKLSLTLFADFAYVAVPLTYDKNSLLELLKHIDVGVAGTQKTALYEALYLSSNIFKNSKSKNRVAILLTDGINTTNNIPLDVAIARANNYDIKVYTVGIGSRGDYNPMILEDIANATGGKFFEANSIDSLKSIYETIDNLEKSELEIKNHMKIEYFYQYPLYIALCLMLILMVLNWRDR